MRTNIVRADQLVDEILEELSADELVEIKYTLDVLKKRYLENSWPDSGFPIDCQNRGLDISHLNAKQRLYLVQLKYKVVNVWDSRMGHQTITLHLY